MTAVSELKRKVISGENVARSEALALERADLAELTQAADEIRREFCGKDFDMCAVVSAKGGRCTENCRFCPQSASASSVIKSFPFLSAGDILPQASLRASQGIRRLGLVASGRKTNRRDVEKAADAVRQIRRETGLLPCVSLGLLDRDEILLLKDAGVVRVHNNLETSARFFPQLCTSHAREEKAEVIRIAHEAGLEVCSGGIIGAGETMADRIDLALDERELGTESVPVNMLDPVPGTPLERQPVLTKEEVMRTIAIFRFILPKAQIRLAAGRKFLDDAGLSCFLSGANASITGDMLNVRGISVGEDRELIRGLGYCLQEDGAEKGRKKEKEANSFF